MSESGVTTFLVSRIGQENHIDVSEPYTRGIIGNIQTARTALPLISELGRDENYSGTSQIPFVGRVSTPGNEALRLALLTERYATKGYLDQVPNGYTTPLSAEQVVALGQDTQALIMNLKRLPAGQTILADQLYNGDGIAVYSTGSQTKLFLDKHMPYSTPYMIKVNGNAVGSARIIAQEDNPSAEEGSIIWEHLMDRTLDGASPHDLVLSADGEFSQVANVSRKVRLPGTEHLQTLPLILRAVFEQSLYDGYEDYNLTFNIDQGLQHKLSFVFEMLEAEAGLIRLGHPIQYLGSQTQTWLLNRNRTMNALADAVPILVNTISGLQLRQSVNGGRSDRQLAMDIGKTFYLLEFCTILGNQARIDQVLG